MGYVSDLAAALEAEFPGVTVVPHPVEVVPEVPCVLIYPDNPYVEPSEFCDEMVNVQVLIVQARANDREILDIAEGTVNPTRSAVTTVQGKWVSMDLQPIDIEGNSYLAAVHAIQLTN